MSTDGVIVKRPKERLESIKRQHGTSIKSLCALAEKNDPFNSGSDTDIAQAQWFADWFAKFDFERGVHLRRIHYRIVSQKVQVLRHDGAPYHNTVACWQYLQSCAKHARYLGLVDPLHFVDQRNPDPYLFAPPPCEPPAPGCELTGFYGFALPSIDSSLYVDFDLPRVSVTGYDYDPGDQPVLLELWIEKSTMDDVLIPVCQSVGANYVTSVGFQSITAAVNVYSRAAEYVAMGRPVRILYISDFDPAGVSMPVGVSRQLEFWREQLGPYSDIALTPLALTREQVRQYELPRIPIKETDMRKGRFEDCYGEGAVELDALEALHPGELARIVENAFDKYRDSELQWRMAEAGQAARQRAQCAFDELVEEDRDHLEKLRERAQKIMGKYLPTLSEMSDQLAEELAPISEEVLEIEQRVYALIDDTEEIISEYDLPERPKAELTPPDERDWLFDSKREFREQLEYYRRHREGKL